MLVTLRLEFTSRRAVITEYDDSNFLVSSDLSEKTELLNNWETNLGMKGFIQAYALKKISSCARVKASKALISLVMSDRG